MKYIVCILSLIIHSSASLAQGSSFTEEEVSFKNRDVVLAGTLIIPNESKKFPAIVFLHGSGPHEREGFRTYAEEFAKLGFASLAFDKRGTGSSGGSWVTSSLKDLAMDGLAALEYLKQRDEIDNSRIGFWGVSQAGWMAPVAASLSKDVAFMIIISGGGASPYASELHSYKAWFSAERFSQNEVDDGINLINSYMDYLSTGRNRADLASGLDTVLNENLKQVSQALSQILPSDKNRPNWAWVANYDPAEDISQLNIPVLILTGDKDNNHPSELANEKWRQGFENNPELLTIVVYPGAGHGIRMGGGHNVHGAFADGYWEVQFGWLWRNVLDK